LRYPSYRTTETGEGVVTVNLLLDTIADAIRRAYISGAVDEVSCSHLVGAMETLCKMGVVDVEEEAKQSTGRPPVSTSPAEPPSWLSDAFKKKGDEDGGATANV
jgi:hypothetical protein